MSGDGWILNVVITLFFLICDGGGSLHPLGSSAGLLVCSVLDFCGVQIFLDIFY